MSEIVIEKTINDQPTGDEQLRNNHKKNTKRNSKLKDKSKENSISNKTMEFIKDTASKRFMATFLVHRLKKNPSYYKLRAVK